MVFRKYVQRISYPEVFVCLDAWALGCVCAHVWPPQCPGFEELWAVWALPSAAEERGWVPNPWEGGMPSTHSCTHSWFRAWCVASLENVTSVCITSVCEADRASGCVFSSWFLLWSMFRSSWCGTKSGCWAPHRLRSSSHYETQRCLQTCLQVGLVEYP